MELETQVFLGLGSNLGDSEANLREAQRRLAMTVVSASSVYETEPVGYLKQPWFKNTVIRVSTDLSPFDLLRRCREIELEMKRQRTIPMGPRTIDLDILFYGDSVVQEPELIIPHPAIAVRRSVLDPLAEIAPGFVHPVLQKTVAELLRDCPDTSTVRRLGP